MKLIIGSDKNTIDFKNSLKSYLLEIGCEVIDKVGEQRLNCVQVAKSVSEAVIKGEGYRGIIIDEYGTASFIVASKYKNIICAQLADEHSAMMTREHNNANMITIGANVTTLEIAKSIAKKFIKSEYAGGRHEIRVDMLKAMIKEELV